MDNRLNRIFHSKNVERRLPRVVKRLHINGLDPEVLPRVIATLCPTFNDKQSLPLLLDVLATLKRKYDVFFFVLQHKCKNPKETIPDDEIEKLERYGTVEVFSPEGAEPPTIARAFKRFIRRYA